ncbi:MAG: hypothetical protein JEZ10_00415 [Verrucomicrobia bacterium]|nr:hypothetical protein [Verrucomicrobiota bacterium]
MKRILKMEPKHLRGLMGILLVVMVLQYALMTGLVRPVGMVFLIMQIFCYLLLIAAVFRGFIQRSRLAWLVTQTMLFALFDFSILFTAVSTVLSLKTETLWGMAGAVASITILNGLLVGVLFSIPVRQYFRPFDDNQ